MGSTASYLLAKSVAEYVGICSDTVFFVLAAHLAVKRHDSGQAKLPENPVSLLCVFDGFWTKYRRQVPTLLFWSFIRASGALGELGQNPFAASADSWDIWTNSDTYVFPYAILA